MKLIDFVRDNVSKWPNSIEMNGSYLIYFQEPYEGRIGFYCDNLIQTMDEIEDNCAEGLEIILVDVIYGYFFTEMKKLKLMGKDQTVYLSNFPIEEIIENLKSTINEMNDVELKKQLEEYT